jgi:hypothetical protein
MLLFTAAVFGSFGTCNLGMSAWRITHLNRENPKRERILRDFLSEPTNYGERLGGKLTSYRLERNYSDLFATYTIFVCSGEIDKRTVKFQAQVLRDNVYIVERN